MSTPSQPQPQSSSATATANVQKAYEDREKNAHKLLTLKNVKLECTQRQQLNRTALSALTKQQKELSGNKKSEKIWISVGGTFMRMTLDQAVNYLREDTSVVEKEIYEIDVELKRLSHDVVDVSVNEEMKVLAKAVKELKPISSEELYGGMI